MQTIWAAEALLPEGWAQGVAVGLSEGRIASVTSGTAPPPGAPRLGVLLPAPVNLHSHAFQRAMAGLTEARGPDGQDSFWTWRRLMFAFLDRLTPEDVEAIAALVQVEMLEAGFAAVAEFHYLHHAPGGVPYADPAEMAGRIAAAAARTGIGLTLLPVHYQFGGCDGRALAPGQVRFGTDPEGFARLLEASVGKLAPLPPDAVLGVAPHSLRAVSPEGLALCLALRPGAPIHMHLAEQVAEVEEVRAARGARPVEWLLANAPVDARWCLIHCTQMERPETLALAATGAVAGLCPLTEASLGDGIFDGVAWLGAGGAFGIGSDSNIRVRLAEELRQLETSQRLRDRSRAALAVPGRSSGRVLIEGAARGGAQAAGRAAGAIAPGLWADLVALDPDTLDLAGLTGDTRLDALVFAGGDAAVAEVWSAGRHVVRGGRHIARDAIEAAYRRVVAGLRA
jgi:formimidoylglutamate deiminase